MAVPKRRKSKSRRDMRRREAIKVGEPALSICPQCGAAKFPHRVCLSCGYYKGREIIKMEEK
jgi:large subunit ribosomal protein L32